MQRRLSQGPVPRIAVIGGGISGMGAAHRLSLNNHVTLFEAEPRLGGHARTVLAGRNGNQPVDTGFIVFNHVNYPHLTTLFDELNVPTAKSNMSFAASIDGGQIEYAINTLNSLFGQRRNALRPAFMGMLRDIMRFNRNAEELARSETMTIGELIAQLDAGPAFRDHYLLPFSGAIWSTPTQDILDFPAAAMVRFFRNHALLDTKGQHQWYTVKGGSIEYVSRLERALAERDVALRLGSPVDAVRRTDHGVDIKAGGAWDSFDEVIFATHSDDALRLIADPTAHETEVLGTIRYQPNEAVLHADPAAMPRRRRCWASWNYVEAPDHASERISLTYWMNSLQPILKSDPLFVTLNASQPIRDELTYDTVTFRHPLYDTAALRAQAQVRAMNGTNRTWFCGAWMKNGFHEDGLSSALDVADAIALRPVRPLAA